MCGIWLLPGIRSLCNRIDADAFQPLSENDITSPTKKLIIWILRRPFNRRKALLENSHILGQNEAI
jgi:hypothetical protein